MVRINVKEEYEKIKYKLPKFNDLDHEFEISLIKDKEFLLRSIRRKMSEKLIFFCRIIESLLYPTANHIINMNEVKEFSEDEKKNMEKIYKKLMVFERDSLNTDVEPDEKKDVEFINDLFKGWPNLKKDILKITKKMRESWLKEHNIKKDNYFG
ncbi:MAG: hypothetical protein KJ674_02630 [Nanoarchaeota archaeon]|nr:hypothetical protein [Nanoarchaeota archaeon]